MKRRNFLMLGGTVVIGGAWACAQRLTSDAEQEDRLEDFSDEAAPLTVTKAGLTPRQIRPLKERLVPAFTRKRPPQSGEWLDKHEESGETFEEHLAAHRYRVCDQYKSMYVATLGELTPLEAEVVAQTTGFMKRFFDMSVRTLPSIPLNLPDYARRENPSTGVPQLLSTYLLTEVLEPRRPKDAVSLLGLTASDLWPGEGWNYVFGQASITTRVGVWSIYRNGDPEKSEAEKALFLRRTLKTAVHETGHMLGMPHCIAYECGMNGANHLEESDGQPLEFCPECQAKLWWTCGADPRQRLRSLIEFAEGHSLDKDISLWEATLAQLES